MLSKPEAEFRHDCGEAVAGHVVVHPPYEGPEDRPHALDLGGQGELEPLIVDKN